ncbi:MAG: hypothetical protein RIE58_07775 [Vicingaceae bacterium]
MRVFCITIMIFMAFHFQSVAQQLASSKNYREVTVNQNDQTLVFHVCSSAKQINHRDKVMYYWYQNNKVHANKGSHSGQLMHGMVQVYDKEGNLVEQWNVKYGIKRGDWKQWSKNGRIAASARWKNGKKNGLEKYFDSDGNLTKKVRFYKGHQIGSEKIYIDGIRVKGEKVKKEKKATKKLDYEILNGDKGSKKKRKEQREKKNFMEWLKKGFKKSEDGSTIT